MIRQYANAYILYIVKVAKLKNVNKKSPAGNLQDFFYSKTYV